jgi:DNA polymerase III sliding clamp (beta) subunit (PCNA family)
MINSKDLLAALRFCKHALPKADRRAQLHGIWLTTYHGKLRIEASNGHGLARCTLDVPALVAGTVTSVRTDNLAAVNEARLVHGDKTITLDELQARQQIDGPMLDFDRVFPHGEPKGVPMIGFDAQLVATAFKAALGLTNKHNVALLKTYSATDAICVTIPTAYNPYPSMTDDAHYLVMPTRL